MLRGEAKRAYNRTYYKAHRDRILTKVQEYYDTHRLQVTTRMREDYAVNREKYLTKVRDCGWNRRKNTGWTPEMYAQAFASQEGKCAICGLLQPEKALAADHCHNSKRIRALLCDACNKGLGHFRDNPELLEVAAGYLRKYQLTEEMKVQ